MHGGGHITVSVRLVTATSEFRQRVIFALVHLLAFDVVLTRAATAYEQMNEGSSSHGHLEETKV